MIEAPLTICLLMHAAAAAPRNHVQIRKVLDPRLSMELVAAEPEIELPADEARRS